MAKKDYDLSDEIERIANKEAEAKSAPTKKDYEEAETILEGFGIEKYVPKFKSKTELQRFLKSKIDEHLENYP